MKILITGGGLSINIDPIRSINNYSSGELSSLFCDFFSEKKDVEKIIFLHTKNIIFKPQKNDKIEKYIIDDIFELKEKILEFSKNKNIRYIFHLMAVNDYYLEQIIGKNKLNNKIILNKNEKINSTQYPEILLKLKKTEKIISILRDVYTDAKIVGFKLIFNLNDIEKKKQIAQDMLDKYKLDYVVMNDYKDVINNYKALIFTHNNYKKIVKSKRELVEYFIKNITF